MNALSLTRTLLIHGGRHWIRNPQPVLVKHCFRGKHDQQSNFFSNREAYVADNDTFPSDPVMELDMPMAGTGLDVVAEPTLASLGLCSYTPVGLLQRAMEFLHISADLHWWGVIATSAVIIRLSLLPIVIRNRKATTNYINCMSDIQRLSMEITDAQRKGDMEKLTRLATHRQEVVKKLPFRDMFFLPLVVQGGTLMSMLYGLRGMATLPVESMQTGGMAWFQDLTVADPYFILPLISSAAYLIIIETNAESGQEMNKNLKTVFRLIAPVIFIFTVRFQSALTLYFSINGVITLVQALAFRDPRVKRACGIGETKKMEHIGGMMPSKKNFHDSLREAMDQAKLIDEINERERLQQLSEKKSKKKS